LSVVSTYQFFSVYNSMKECIKCGEKKPLSEYTLRKDSGKHRNDCKQCCNAVNRQWKIENDFDRKQYIKHREKKLAGVRAYRKKNPDKVREAKNTWRRNKKLTDPTYKLTQNLRRRALGALNGKYKHATTKKLLGCSYEEVREHLENQFVDGMTWDNYGINGWTVDHIIPVSSFDLTKEEEQKKCFHYTNLQPLWAEDNISKSNKL